MPQTRKKRERREVISAFSCPHCGNLVELVNQRDLTNEYNLKPQPVAYARTKGLFPDPAIQVENNTWYLRTDIEKYLREREQGKIAERAEALKQSLAVLSDSEREQVLAMLSSDIPRRRR